MVIYSVTSQGKVESITGSETGSEVEVVWFMEQYLFPFVGTSHHTTSSPGTMTLVGEKLSLRLVSQCSSTYIILLVGITLVTELFPLIIAPCQVLRWSHNLASPVAMGHATRKV